MPSHVRMRTKPVISKPGPSSPVICWYLATSIGLLDDLQQCDLHCHWWHMTTSRVSLELVQHPEGACILVGGVQAAAKAPVHLTADVACLDLAAKGFAAVYVAI